MKCCARCKTPFPWCANLACGCHATTSFLDDCLTAEEAAQVAAYGFEKPISETEAMERDTLRDIATLPLFIEPVSARPNTSKEKS